MSELFTRGSTIQLRALSNLRDALRRVGFYVEAPRATEDTLRVYPVRRHQLPLLNPRFAPGAKLEIAVLSKGVPGLDTRLLGFQPTAVCRFVHKPDESDGYRRHGHFEIAVTGSEDAPAVPPTALRDIHACLTAPRGPA